MKNYLLAMLATLLFASLSFAQEVHSDIEFGYDDPAAPAVIVVESDELTSQGIQITEGEFEDDFGDVFAENPGFITAADEGLRVNSGDRITVRFLDASEETNVGVGFVNYYNPTTGEITNVGQIEVTNQAGDTADLNGAVLTGSEALLLSLGSDGGLVSNPGEEGEEPELLPEGEIHNHLVFDLQGDEAAGAYGILFEFEADFADENGDTDDVVDVTSEPIWLIFNNGMDDVAFEEEAVEAFVGALLLGDIDLNGMVNFSDITPLISLLSSGEFQAEADFDQNGFVNFLDVSPFIFTLSGQ